MARVPSIFAPGALLGAGDPFLTLHREMNRLFDDVLREGSASSGGDRSAAMLAPSIDVSENEGEITVHAEMPGVAENDIDVQIHEDVLTIRAEKRHQRKEDRGGLHFSERSFGHYQRALRLPVAVDPDKVQARFDNGVLTVTLPKAAQEQRTKRIQVQSAKPTIEGQS